jgi:hypothetical protein
MILKRMIDLNQYDKDHLVEPEDVVCDGICKAVTLLPFADDFEVDAEKFFEEVHSRSKKLRIDLAFEILGVKSRAEFEEMMHELYLKGI